jgi:hypothetical protein
MRNGHTIRMSLPISLKENQPIHTEQPVLWLEGPEESRVLRPGPGTHTFFFSRRLTRSESLSLLEFTLLIDWGESKKEKKQGNVAATCFEFQSLAARGGDDNCYCSHSSV